MTENVKMILQKHSIEVLNVKVLEKLVQIKTKYGYIRIYKTKKGDRLDLSLYQGNKFLFCDLC